MAISDVIRNEGFTANDLSILIIDDDELVCESLASILQGIFQVEYTSSPERALEKLRRKPYDLVLSDLQMPIMTGDELYMAVKKLRSQHTNTLYFHQRLLQRESSRWG